MRTISEILQPHLLDQRSAFENQFMGMASIPFTYVDYEVTRNQLINAIQSQWSDKDRSFLLSFKRGEPDWNLSSVPELKNLPAVNWKLGNIKRLIHENHKKHDELVNRLEKVLFSTK